MRILVVGGTGTLGSPVVARLTPKHEVITAGRNSGDIRVDITSGQAIERMFGQAGRLDACICTAASGAMDDFETLTTAQLLENMQAKLLGQINLVLIGQRYLADGGSFTLTSGIFADEPWKGVTSGGVISGALHSFVLSAAIELKRGLRINAVSPGMAEESAALYGHLFPGLTAVSTERLVEAFAGCVEGVETGRIVRVYR
jgi:NAD(P)-dependent dehydrogenase (short-subunit alcohol dehydrogenase family)